MEIDTTKPNAARIYDYFLGGSHNYPADRAAARRITKLIPEAPQTARLYRYFLHCAVFALVKHDFQAYLDLATGIPTEGYLHELVPETVRIIYNDIDAETVAHTRQIVGDRPNIRSLQGDLRAIEPILAEAEQFFGGERRIGICLVNVSYFIEDAPLAHVFRQLYAWAAPGSLLAVSGVATSEYSDDPQIRQVIDFYRSIGTPLHYRTPEELLQLAAPWQVQTPFRPVEQYAEERLPGEPLMKTEHYRGKLGYAGILVRS